MTFSRKPSHREEDHGSHDAWSSAFPPHHDQLFNQNSFGGMKLPLSPHHDHESVGVEARETSSPRPDSFVASSILNTVPFKLDHSISPDRSDFGHRKESFSAHQPPPPIHEPASYEMDHLREPSKPRRVHRPPLRGEVTPYLGLRARLTQIPINRWTILILLVLVRMIILFERLSIDFTNAQQEATMACSKVEDIGSALASMPHYLSEGGKFRLS